MIHNIGNIIGNIVKLIQWMVIWSICNRILRCQSSPLAALFCDLFLGLVASYLKGTLNSMMLKIELVSTLPLLFGFLEPPFSQISYLYLLKWMHICYGLYSLQHTQLVRYNKYLCLVMQAVLMTAILVIVSRFIFFCLHSYAVCTSSVPQQNHFPQLDQILYDLLPLQSIQQLANPTKQFFVYSGLTSICIIIVAIFSTFYPGLGPDKSQNSSMID